MSAGTLIELACKGVVIGIHSNLGGRLILKSAVPPNARHSGGIQKGYCTLQKPSSFALQANRSKMSSRKFEEIFYNFS